jgi:hypothetical protein
VGTYEGPTYFFRNTGTPTAFAFTLEDEDIFRRTDTRPELLHASPYCFSYDPTREFNGCFVGAGDGTVVAYAGGGVILPVEPAYPGNGLFGEDQKQPAGGLPFKNFSFVSGDVFEAA